MSGVRRIALAENKGQSQVTNEDLREEGVGSASVEDKNEGTENK